MNLAQENFERAALSASDTLKTLYGRHPRNIDLSQESTRTLRTWAWDLEAIGAALRLELMEREKIEPQDFRVTEDLTRQLLESEVERLQARNEELTALLSRPVNVHLPAAPDSAAMSQVVQYLPQLTMIATNLSFVASAVQATNTTLERIAKALEEKGKKP